MRISAEKQYVRVTNHVIFKGPSVSTMLGGLVRAPNYTIEESTITLMCVRGWPMFLKPGSEEGAATQGIARGSMDVLEN